MITGIRYEPHTEENTLLEDPSNIEEGSYLLTIEFRHEAFKSPYVKYFILSREASKDSSIFLRKYIIEAELIFIDVLWKHLKGKSNA